MPSYRDELEAAQNRAANLEEALEERDAEIARLRAELEQAERAPEARRERPRRLGTRVMVLVPVLLAVGVASFAVLRHRISATRERKIAHPASAACEAGDHDACVDDG